MSGREQGVDFLTPAIADRATPTEDRGVGPSCPSGAVEGIACDPLGAPLSGALISVETRDCDARPLLRRGESDRFGRFRIDGLAPGAARITISAGRFSGRSEVEVFSGATVPPQQDGAKLCLNTEGARVLVSTGDYDQVERLLDRLGLPYERRCGERRHYRPLLELIDDEVALRDLDILLINCATGLSLDAPEDEARRARLRAFVARGGGLYISDLSGGLIESLWPGWVDFESRRARQPAADDPCCRCGQCPARCEATETEGEAEGRCEEPNLLPARCRGVSGVSGAGNAGEQVGRIENLRLQRALNRELVPLRFDAGGWLQIRDVDPRVEILVSGAESQEPLMVRFSPEGPSAGQVVFTSFHYSPQQETPVLQLLEAILLRL
ncbi:MAG: carboxypeptidase-like regulatory domain-containing protein [Myxococcota bacterium]|nr:carboxypeptidase-like regulatory domain-containing protein [Myxococcota bacterium]